jgi:hypothetical protein
MLRRISVIAAAAAMLALSALPALAITHSSTHKAAHFTTRKLSFPSQHGVQAWGTYKKFNRSVKLYVCVKDTGSSFAVGAVTQASNSANTRVTNFGAVAIGHGQTVCRGPVTLHYAGHLRVFTFTAGTNGRIHKSKIKKIY